MIFGSDHRDKTAHPGPFASFAPPPEPDYTLHETWAKHPDILARNLEFPVFLHSGPILKHMPCQCCSVSNSHISTHKAGLVSRRPTSIARTPCHPDNDYHLVRA